MKKYVNKKNAVRLTAAGVALTVASMFYVTGCSGKSSSDGGGSVDGGDGGGIVVIGDTSMCNVPLEASLSTQERIGGAVTNVKPFMADDKVTEWTLYNIANELRATRVDTPESTVGLEVEGFIHDIEIVNYNGKRYALLAMGEEGITAVNISNPNSMIIEPNVESVKVNYEKTGLDWTEGGGAPLHENDISSTRGPVSSLAVYDEGNATAPSLQLLIGDEGYGLHKTALNNLFVDTNESREADGTLKIDDEVYTLLYAGENAWGGPKSLTLHGEGNNTRLFVAQGFLGMGIYDPKTLDKVGYYNHYTDTNVTEDWFIDMNLSNEVQSADNIDACTGMPNYLQASYEIQTVWHDKVDAPTPWADFDRYGKFYYDARRVDVATFTADTNKTIAYIAYGLGGMVAVDVTGYDTAIARDENCTSNEGFKIAKYLGYVPGLPAHGPDAQTGEQSKSLFPYFGAGMLKEAGVVDVKVNADTKEVYFSDHFAGLMVIGNANDPENNWYGVKGKDQYDNDDNNISGDHWPDYEFVTSYDMTPEIPDGKEEAVPTFISESPILLATGEVSGHGNVFDFTSTGSGLVDVVLASGGGGLNFMDVLIAGEEQSSNSFDVLVHFATTDEIGAAADGSPTEGIINIGHAEGVAAYANLLFLGDGPHGMSVWKIADEECYPTDDVHLVANTLQSEYSVGDINPTPHAHEVILDHATNSALVMSQSRGVRRVTTSEIGTVGAPVLLYPEITDIYEHNKDEGNVAEFLSMQDHAYSAALKGSLAFTADGSNGLTVYDLSKDPTDLTNSNGYVVANIGGDTDSQPDLGRVSGVALWDHSSTGIQYAFVAAGSRGIAVVDVSNVLDNNMTLIKIFEPIKYEDESETKAGKADGKSVAVKVVGDHVFFTYDSFGIVAYSIADLIAPLPDGMDPQDIWEPGTVGERPEAAARFKLKDASSYINQTGTNFAELGGGSAGMDVVSVNDKNIFYVAYGAAGVVKIDWTDPTSPILMEHANTVGYASDAVVINGRVYVADSGGGLTLLK